MTDGCLNACQRMRSIRAGVTIGNVSFLGFSISATATPMISLGMADRQKGQKANLPRPRAYGEYPVYPPL